MSTPATVRRLGTLIYPPRSTLHSFHQRTRPLFLQRSFATERSGVRNRWSGLRKRTDAVCNSVCGRCAGVSPTKKNVAKGITALSLVGGICTAILEYLPEFRKHLKRRFNDYLIDVGVVWVWKKVRTRVGEWRKDVVKRRKEVGGWWNGFGRRRKSTESKEEEEQKGWFSAWRRSSRGDDKEMVSSSLGREDGDGVMARAKEKIGSAKDNVRQFFRMRSKREDEKGEEKK